MTEVKKDKAPKPTSHKSYTLTQLRDEFGEPYAVEVGAALGMTKDEVLFHILIESGIAPKGDVIP